MGARPIVYVVVLNWNRWPDTIRCLDSLKRLQYAPNHILAVDNGSIDESVERMRAAYPEIELLATGQNLGFAGGNNAGIREALSRGADYAWVLNNDAVVEPDSLTALVEVVRENDRIGIAGPSVWRPPSEGQAVQEPAAFEWRGEARRTATCPLLDNEAPYHLVDDVSGGSALLKAQMLQEVGLFDERFFHYWEDVELCARARRGGWLVAHACQARAWHTVGGSLSTASPQAQYYFVRNWLLFARWTGRGGLLTILRRAPRMTIALVLARRWLLRGRWRMPLAGLLGSYDAVRGRYGRRDVPGWLS